MRTLLLIGLVVGMNSTAFSQAIEPGTTRTTNLSRVLQTPANQAVPLYAEASLLSSKRLKPVAIYSFDAIEESKRNQIKEDCRILDRLINKAFPKLNQNTLGINVNHNPTCNLLYVAGKGFVLTYHLPYHLGAAMETKSEKPKKELTEWEKARSELTDTVWQSAQGSANISLTYSQAVLATASLSRIKSKELSDSLVKTLLNTKNIRAIEGETVTVFVYGKVNNLQRNVLAFEVPIGSKLTEKDIRTRSYSEKIDSKITAFSSIAR